MPKYRYSLATNFGGKINLRKLHKEIEVSGGITKAIIGVTQIDNDDIDVEFDLSLSTQEQTELETVVIPNHDNSPSDTGTSVKTVILHDNKKRSTSWTKLGSILFPGTIYSSITAIKILSYQQSQLNNHQIRVYDITNNNIVAEGTFTNETLAINDLGTISNVPSNDSIFEIQGKGDSNRWFYYDSISFYLF